MRRVIALLGALAVLAERAADRSWPVRCLVLWLLRRAEAVAAEFVLEATGAPPFMEDIAPVGNDPADAMLLAARLKALAALLCALLPAGGRRPRRRGIDAALRRFASRMRRIVIALADAAERCDTS